MENTASHNSTNVRFSLLDSATRTFPAIGEKVLRELFFTPHGKHRGQSAQGKVIDELQVGSSRVRVRAEGHGPAVALVHGWRGSSLQFTPLKAALNHAGFSVVTFDMPAHGESGGRTTHLAEFVETVHGVMDCVGPLHGIVAHSLGGTATALALSERPEVNAVSFIAPMVSFDFALDEFSKVLKLGNEARELTARAAERKSGLKRSEVDLLTMSRPALPIQLIHDVTDKRTPFTYSSSLKERWGVDNFLQTEGLGHNRILADAGVLDSVVDFVAHVDRRPADPLESSFGIAPAML